MKIKLCLSVILLLVSCRGSFFNLKNKIEIEEMFILIEEDKLEEIEQLSEEDLNVKDEDGYLLIHKAVLTNKVEAFKILFNKYIKENDGQEKIETLEGKYDIYEFVTIYGTKDMFNEMDEQKYRFNIMEKAYKEGKKKILKEIYKYKESKKIHRYAFEGNVEKLKEEIEKGKIEEKDKNENGVLYYAVSNNQKKSLELLIEAGADVNTKTNNIRTILMFAAEKNNKEFVEYLIDKEAEVNAVNIYG